MDAVSLTLLQSQPASSVNVQGKTHQTRQTSDSKGFHDLFHSVLTDGQTNMEAEATESVAPENPELTEEQKEVLGQMLQLLQNDDSPEWGDLEEAFDEVEKILASLLEIDAENIDLKKELFKLLDSEDDLSGIYGGIDLQPLMNFLHQMLFLPDDEFIQQLNTDSLSLLKWMKIFDAFSSQQNLKGKGVFADLLSQLQDKLKNLLNEGNTATSAVWNQLKNDSRLIYLQNKFSQAAAEANAGRVQSLSSGGSINEQSFGNEKLDSFSGFLQMQQMSKAEQLTLLTQTGKPVSAEHLIRQFENVLAKSQFTNLGGTQRLMLKLYPEHLGSLRIELIQKDGSITAKMLTSTDAAKNLLESQLQGLKQAFASQNIQVDKIEIAQQYSQQQENFLNQEGQKQEQRHQQQNIRPTEDGEDEESFSLTLEDALVNMEV